jgi:hypothetical protein
MVKQYFIQITTNVAIMYMKTTTLAIIGVFTAMILVTAGAFSSPALAKPSIIKSKETETKSKDTGTKNRLTETKSKDTGTKNRLTETKSKDTATSSSSGTSSTGTTSTVSKKLKSLISCLTSTSKSTGTLPTSSQYKTCQAQSSAGTIGGSSTVGAGKSGGGLVSSTSGVVGTSFLGTPGKTKTSSSSSASS